MCRGRCRMQNLVVMALTADSGRDGSVAEGGAQGARRPDRFGYRGSVQGSPKRSLRCSTSCSRPSLGVRSGG